MAEYIERETLINACKKIIHDRWNETTAPVSWSHAYADFIDDITEQPAVDVRPERRGKWIKKRSIYAQTGRFFECSCCGRQIEALSGELNYCPNCGAKMDGKDDKNA